MHGASDAYCLVGVLQLGSCSEFGVPRARVLSVASCPHDPLFLSRQPPPLPSFRPLFLHAMPPSSSPSSSFLLSSLKDYSQCTLELTSAIRSTVLDPFEPPRSKHATTQPLSRAQQKTLAVKLAPLAMKIVNQNIGSLQDLKVPGKVDTSIYNTTVECLVDTTCIALAALRYMAAYTTLKPLDIEKLTSNLVCKLVDLKEVQGKENAIE